MSNCRNNQVESSTSKGGFNSNVEQASYPIDQSTLAKEKSADNHTNIAECLPSCKRCSELQLKVKQLELKIKKLTEENARAACKSIIAKLSPERTGTKDDESRIAFSPKQLRYSFDVKDVIKESEEKLLQELQQRAQKLCKKEKKQRQIIKKILQENQNQSCDVTLTPQTKSHLKGNPSINRSLNLSKSEISPIKEKGIKLVKVTRAESFLIDTPSRQQIKTEPKQKKVLDIPSSFLIEEIPKRESKRPSNFSFMKGILQGGLALDPQEIGLILNDQISQVKKQALPAASSEETMSYSSNLTASNVSITSKERLASMTPQQTEEYYKMQMRKSKLNAKFRRKK